MASLFQGASIHEPGGLTHSIPIPSGASGRPTSLTVPSSAQEPPSGSFMDTSGDPRSLSSSAGNYGMDLPTDVEMTPTTPQQRLLPTVFRWNGGGNDIYVSGTFNNWQSRIPMARRLANSSTPFALLH